MNSLLFLFKVLRYNLKARNCIRIVYLLHRVNEVYQGLYLRIYLLYWLSLLLARFHNLIIVEYLNLLETFLVENLPCEGALVRSDECEPLLGKVN